MTPQHIVAEIEDLFAEHGSEQYGESVTMLQHLLLTAAAAEANGASNALIVACLLHDVGHFLGDADDESGHRTHDQAAADYLVDRFDAEVVEPVRLHVAAKRYLCAVEPGYVDELSLPSVHSLERQGGPMSPAEVAEFLASPHADQAIALRRWEDRHGKDHAAAAPDLAHFLPLVEQAAAKHLGIPAA